MNILPMIIFCTLALAAFVSSFFQKGADITIEHRAMISLSTLRRQAEQSLQEVAFTSAKAKPKPRTPTEKKPSTPMPQPSPRETPPLSDAAKINLMALFTDQGSEPLYQIAKNLIETLYHLPTKETETLLSLIIAKGKQHLDTKEAEKPSLWFDDLFPDDPHYKNLYYRILRGTRHYTPQEGYPPLTHFFTFATTEKIANFPYLPPQILSALFSPEETQEILERETKLQQEGKKSHLTLTAAELEGVIRNKALVTHLDFPTKHIKEPTIRLEDDKTLITFEMRTD